MAKGKHAAALFEVIHQDKRFGGTGRGLLRTPKWWFKGRRGAAAASTESPGAAVVSTAPEIPSSPGFALRFDGERQQVTLRLSYTAALISGFALIVVIGLAYLLGRQTRPAMSLPILSSATTDQLKSGPAQPEVMEINRPAAPEEAAAEEAVAESALSSEPNQVSPTFNDPRPPATLVVQGGKRNIGLNYAVIQSYADAKIAQDACNILNKNGVACSIERELKGWKGLYFVVGQDGFNRISSPEFKNYLKRIEQVSDQFAPRKSYKAFQPVAYKWDRR